MLTVLTDYLFCYKKVTLPHVGTFTLVHLPAQLRLADKRLDSPSYSIELVDGKEVTAHQLSFIANSLGKKLEETATDLQQFGKEVEAKMATSGFEWIGLTTIKADTKTIPLPALALAPVIAEKVVRQDVAHPVLQGDKELTSMQIIGEKSKIERSSRPSSVSMIIGWIILALALLAIVFLLYNGKFKVGSAGLKLPALSVTILHKQSLNS